MRHFFRAFVLAIGGLTFSACDSSEPTPGSFAITTEGAAAVAFSGEPVTLVNDLSSDTGPYRGYDFHFVNEIVDGRTRPPLVSITARPGSGVSLEEGEYLIGVPQNDPAPGRAIGTAVLSEGDDLRLSFFSRSGTLTLTDVTGDRVRGSFEFEGVGESGDVTVRGTFEADLNASFPR